MARAVSRGEIHAGQLADSLASSLSVSRLFARQILSAATGLITSHLLAGRAVTLRGFGRFHLKRVAAKRLRCGSHNRRVVTVEAHAAPAWLPCDTLRAAVRAITSQPCQPGQFRPQTAINHGGHGGHGERQDRANGESVRQKPMRRAIRQGGARG